MRIHHIHPLVHWQRLIWFTNVSSYGFQFRIEVILWSSWWLKTPTHFFKYAVFKYSASSAHLWSCYEHHVWFFGYQKKQQKCHIFTYQIRLPKLIQVDFSHGFFRSFLHLPSSSVASPRLRFPIQLPGAKSSLVVLDVLEIPWADPHLLRTHELQTTKTGKSWQILSHELRFGWFFSDWQWWQGWGENPAKREGTLWSVLAFLHQVLKLYLHLLEEATPSGRKDSDGKRFQWFQVSTLSGTFIAVFFFDTSSFICFCSACQQHKDAANSLDSKLRMSTLLYEY